ASRPRGRMDFRRSGGEPAPPDLSGGPGPGDLISSAVGHQTANWTNSVLEKKHAPILKRDRVAPRRDSRVVEQVSVAWLDLLDVVDRLADREFDPSPAAGSMNHGEVPAVRRPVREHDVLEQFPWRASRDRYLGQSSAVIHKPIVERQLVVRESRRESEGRLQQDCHLTRGGDGEDVRRWQPQ